MEGLELLVLSKWTFTLGGNCFFPAMAWQHYCPWMSEQLGRAHEVWS